MKGVKTTSDYIHWSDAINVVHKLYRDKNYVMSLFIATGIFTGLRVTDLRSLHWNELSQGGILTVTDADTFCQTLILGIGREKAYGMGLLTVAPYV